MNEIICGNNVDILKSYSNDYFDMVLTSPPYDNLRQYNGFDFDFEGIVKQLWRTLKPGGVIVWVVSDQTVDGGETGTSFKQALYFMSNGFKLHDTMIYKKDNPPPVGGSNRYYQAFEYMFVFSKGKPKTFNPIITQRRNKHNDKRTERIRSFVRSADGSFNKKLIQIKEEVKINNVWEYTVGGGNSVEYGIKHPAAFPLKMAEDHIYSWSNKEDIVLDPFAGSGTTCIAAKKLNRNYIGIEISKEYCDIAEERIKNHFKTIGFNLFQGD